MMQTSWCAVWVTCVMAVASAGCGSSPSMCSAPSIDARPNGDAMPDHAGVDGGPDGPAVGPDGPVGTDGSTPCFVPTDCTSGQKCCLVTGASSLWTVSCQPSASCPGDGVSTFIACATGADCPTAHPTCVFLAATSNGDSFSVCE